MSSRHSTKHTRHHVGPAELSPTAAARRPLNAMKPPTHQRDPLAHPLFCCKFHCHRRLAADTRSNLLSQLHRPTPDADVPRRPLRPTSEYIISTPRQPTAAANISTRSTGQRYPLLALFRRISPLWLIAAHLVPFRSDDDAGRSLPRPQPTSEFIYINIHATYRCADA